MKFTIAASCLVAVSLAWSQDLWYFEEDSAQNGYRAGTCSADYHCKGHRTCNYGRCEGEDGCLSIDDPAC